MPEPRLINWLGHDWRQTRTANYVLSLYRDIFNRFPAQPTPMPIVVLQATEPHLDPGVSETVQVLHGIYTEGGLLCQDPTPQQIASPGETRAVPQLPDWPGANARRLEELRRYSQALGMVRSLTSDDWDNGNESQYRMYKFPRSRMLDAIEAQYADSTQGAASPPDARDVLLGLKWHGRSGPPRRRVVPPLSPAGFLGALLVTVAGAAAGAWLARITPLHAVFIAGSALLALIGVQLIRNNRGPLSWLTQACLWFATTTFLVPTNYADRASRSGRPRRMWLPSRSWQVRLARARLVVDQLIVAEGGRTAHSVVTQSGADQAAVPDREFATVRRAWQFYLQLRVLALLEDLRANHRPWTLDLRHRKRTRPPLAFLPCASEQNGGLTFLQAISDVRSRRSEQDPLLLLAGVPQASDIEHRHEQAGAAGRDGPRRYETWLPTMRVNQSPSTRSAWPWVLRCPVTGQELATEQTDMIQPVAGRSPWTRVWSRGSVALVATLGVVAALFVYRQDAAHARQITERYCGGAAASASHDLVRSPQSPGQCVGIDTTDSIEFVPADGGVRLNGSLPGAVPDPPGIGSGISLRALERLIMIQNKAAEQTPKHFTFVYAGALTSATNGAGEMQVAGAVQELAGLYAWQFSVNNGGGTVPVRIDIANAGQDMNSQVVMAQEIAAAARQDHTIVGVIGLGRDTVTSPAVLRDLGAADLAVVDTTNSDNALAQDWNYFGLAATNREEADSLRPMITHVADKTAVVFVRKSQDPYSRQQAAAGRTMLHRAGFSLIGGHPVSYPVTKDRANFEAAGANSPQNRVCAAKRHPAVVYLAGRSDDLPGLMSLISDNARCFAARVTVLSGDDLTKSELTGGRYDIPGQVTVYYTALTDVRRTGRGSRLAPELQSALKLKSLPSYGDPFFADGVALAFDAAHALYKAATAATDRAGVPSYLRCTQITDAATGQIWFSGVHHGIEIIRVAGRGNDVPPAISSLPYSPATGPATVSAPCQPAAG